MSDAVVGELTGWVARLGCLEPLGPDPVPGALSDADRVELLGALEGLKAAAAAAQARITAAFAASQRESLSAAGVPSARRGHIIGAQVALARRVSPRQGSRHLGLAEALVRELPETLSALAEGRTSEWRATLVAQETACLSREDRLAVDAELAARPGGIGALGDGRAASEARRVAYRLDPGAIARRSTRAAGQRCVTLRPAPDAMTYLTAVLPVAAGVAAHAALARAADGAQAHGDPRSRGQLMADLLTDRLLAPRAAGPAATVAYDPTRWDSPPPAPVPRSGGESGHGAPAGARVEVHLVMTDTALLGQDDTPAELVGQGPVPASVARRLVRDAPEQAQVWVRRLFTDPATGQLAAMDSRSRFFPALLRRFLVLRDEVCRTPWCGAPVRHADHVVAHADGGATSSDNGQGLCASCNQVKESPGWTARCTEDGTIVTTTPTGHTWPSCRTQRWRASRVESAGRTDSTDSTDSADSTEAGADGESPGERRLRTYVTAA